jgi:hypothetical protein
MALNFCVNCDQAFQETKRNPGCICSDCKEEIDAKRKAESEEEFWKYMEKKAGTEPILLKGNDIPDKPNRFYRIR